MSDRDEKESNERDREEGQKEHGHKQHGETKQGSLKSQRTEGKRFPPYHVKEGEEREVRAPRVPTSKEKNVEKQSPASEIKKPKAGGGSGSDPVKFFTYSPSKDSNGAPVSDGAADISGAQNAKGDVIMRSGNWYVELSVDSGGSWKRFDPTTL